MRNVYLFLQGQVLNVGSGGLDGVVLRGSVLNIVPTISFLMAMVGNIFIFLIGISSCLLGDFGIQFSVQAILFLGKFLLGDSHGARQVILGPERGCLSNSSLDQTSCPSSCPYFILNLGHLGSIIFIGSINTFCITMVTGIFFYSVLVASISARAWLRLSLAPSSLVFKPFATSMALILSPSNLVCELFNFEFSLANLTRSGSTWSSFCDMATIFCIAC